MWYHLFMQLNRENLSYISSMGRIGYPSLYCTAVPWKKYHCLNQTAGYDFEMGIVLLQCHIYWIEVYSVCPLIMQLHTEKERSFHLPVGYW